MSITLLHWLDHLPPGCTVLCTAASLESLPLPWRWRIDQELRLPDAMADPYQRQAVFAASLRRHGLDTAAADESLVVELATATDPENGIPRLASASARLAEGPLGRQVARLGTAADIAHWVSETILLHGRDASPAEASFWRAALAPAQEGE
jgi:hypothetical protein